MRERVGAAVLTAGALLAAGGGTASVASAATVTARDAVARDCQARVAPAGSKGVATTTVTAADAGLVRASLRAGGDWDVALFDRRTGELVAASSGQGATEVASGFVAKGAEILVQACRYRGDDATAELTTETVAARSRAEGRTVKVVEVDTPDRAAKRKLQGLGLDLTEHGDQRHIEVVLYGDEDEQRLRGAGFTFRTRIADLKAQAQKDRAADRRFARRPRSDLPSGRTEYRHLADYESELRRLAQRYPGLTKPITLNHRTHEGRVVHGIEITRAAWNVDDGKPIFLNMGAHHAREWPSAENAMEFAYDLLTGYGRDARTTRLVNQARTIVIPVVNPDGFNISREADPGDPADDFSLFDYEMKRKNCAPDPNGPCNANPVLGRLQGVDLNRNYGGLWGGPGATVSQPPDTYRGPAPFSEPETQNIRELQASRTITSLITNHTFGNLLLRPPGTIDVGTPLDEPLLASLGGQMASRNSYDNIPAYGLYDTTGSTEDWTYWTAGSLGYTFEIGTEGFHPAFENAVVGEYLGRAPAAGAGKGGNRAAYFDMLEATADSATHSVITGQAPPLHTLTLSKSFMTSTYDPLWLNDFGTELGEPILFPDALRYQLRTWGGRFDWHVNPSTRPIVAGRLGRDPTGPPQANEPLPNPPGIPAENPWVDSYEEGEYEEIPFTVQGPPDVDNGRLTVHIEWTNPEVDWDLFVLGPDGEIVAQSASFGDANEDAALLDPPPGEYRAIVVNYDQAGLPEDQWDDWTGEVRFQSPSPTVINEPEAWTLTCTGLGGRPRGSREVVVGRGERIDVGRVCQDRHKPKVTAR